MLARRPQRGADEGFTLVEVLVVMLIVGVLAAIAIPIFLHERENAKDATAKSDLRTVAFTLEGYYTHNQTYATPSQSGATLSVGTDTATLTPGDTVTVTFNGVAGTAGSSTAYCIESAVAGATQHWIYESDKGGLQPAGVAACPAATYGLSVPT